MSEPNPYRLAKVLDDCDREALASAALALQGPQGAFNAIRDLIVKRYGLGPMDSFSTDGTINRAEPDPAPSAGLEPAQG